MTQFPIWVNFFPEEKSLSKIHTKLFNVQSRLVISNCGPPTEKVPKFLDHHLQFIMGLGQSYVKDRNDFPEKLNKLAKILTGAIWITAHIVGLYPSILIRFACTGKTFGTA